jgi:hypothetical protein
MSTHSERAAEQRRLKLDEIKAQVKAGSLTIRQMTAKERKSFPPQPPKERGSRWPVVREIVAVCELPDGSTQVSTTWSPGWWVSISESSELAEVTVAEPRRVIVS